MDDLEGILAVVRRLVLQIGQECRQAYRTKKKIEKKSNVDLVTESDKNTEHFLISELRKQYPESLFIAEETHSGKMEITDAPTWIIDPIDGTTNFVHQIPTTGISVGLAIKKEVVLGVVYNFATDELFSAVKGGGAKLNGEPIECSSCKTIGEGLLSTNFGARRDEVYTEFFLDNMRRLMLGGVRSIRAFGSVAVDMCFVAAGRLDAYYDWGIWPWDYAAAKIIVQEAGGVVLDPTGGPHDVIGRQVLACSSKELAQQMAASLNQDHPYGTRSKL